MRVPSTPPERLAELVGRRIRESREARGWSQAELARRLTAAGTRMHQPTIARMEAGTRPVSLDELQVLADAFGSRPGQLVATERADDVARAMWLFQEREARLMVLEDEVRAAELNLRQARERLEAGRELSQEAGRVLGLTLDAHGLPDEDEDDVEPGEEA